MTRKEFAKKYNVDYNIVNDASKRIQHDKFRRKNVQFSESDLGKAVCKEIQGKMNKYRMKVQELDRDYSRLWDICWDLIGINPFERRGETVDTTHS